MIAIVDYGLGNVQAFANIYDRLGFSAVLAKTPSDLAKATHVILPGVGAFDWAIERLEASGMRETLDTIVLIEKKPVLGICVGMQMMAARSDEGERDGLAWFDAAVRRFDETRIQSRTHLPHMGWNDAKAVREHGLMNQLGSGSRFYFLHSYFFAPNNPSDVLAETAYGDRFASAVQRENIHGVQFHPEKSHGWGIQLLKNFAGL